MRGQRLTPPALLLAFSLGLPAAAQQTAAGQQPQPPQGQPPQGGQPPQSQPSSSGSQPPLEPRGPVTSVSPTPGSTPPPSGAPQSPPGPATPPPPPGPPGAGAGRLDFQLKFTGARGGGSAAGSAANLEYKREDYAVLTGDVRLKYQDLDLIADEAEIDLQTKDVIAVGHIILDQGPRRLSGDSMTFNLDTKTGKFRHAMGQMSPDYYFTGDEVEKTGPDTYVIRDGIFTSCSQPVPDWSFRVREAEIQVEGYAHAHGTSMRVKKVPVLYTPWLLWPVKRDRASGFLIPNIGYSQRKGAELGLAYFQTLGRSYDTTVHLDTYTKGFLGVGNEFRYAPTAGTKGDLISQAVYDPETRSWRWKVLLDHTTNDLPNGMRAVVQYQKYSDFNFFRDFERDFDTNTLRFIDSRAFVTGNWGPNLVNLLLEDRETFVDQQNDTLLQRRLPELQYRLRSTQIGKTPFYLELASTASYLDVSRPQNYQGQYGRFDLFPTLTLPVKTFPWLNLSLTGGERLTWYGDTLNQQQTGFTGDTLTRTFPFGGAEIIGPSFSKIFNWNVGELGKFKHLIEPRITYTYQGNVSQEEQTAIPLFDEIDPQTSTNSLRVALDNRLLGKPNTESGVAREVFFFELARNYSFDKTQPLQSSAEGTPTPNGFVPDVAATAGPLEALLRINPTQKISLTATATYNTLFRGIASTGLTGSYGFGANNSIAATWFTRANTETKQSQSNQARLSGAFTLPFWNLRLEAQVNYDFEQHLLQQDQLVMTYTSQCYALRLEFRDFQPATGTAGQVLRDREVRFSLSLKNVGTFLDLNSRSSTIQP
jgi:LPS-assembly protein